MYIILYLLCVIIIIINLNKLNVEDVKRYTAINYTDKIFIVNFISILFVFFLLSRNFLTIV